MAKIRTYVLLCFLSGFVVALRAQDLHFSQFQATPIHLNPAFVGLIHDGTYLTCHYRTQWQPVLNTDAFKTMAASFEQRVPVKKTDFWGWGLTIWQDRAGAQTQSEGKAAVSYARLMAKNGKISHFLLGAGQAGIIQRNLWLDDRRWIGQYDGNGGYDATKPADVVDIPRKTLFDVAMGMAYYGMYDDQHYWTLGFSMQHLNRPDVSTRQSSSYPLLAMRYTVMASGDIAVNRFWHVAPSFLVMKQGAALELMPGAALKMVINPYNPTSLQVGGWLRMVNRLNQGFMNDAFVAMVRLDWGQIGVGLSYDVNVSELKQLRRSNNAMEFAVSYRFGASNGLKEAERPLNVTPRYF